MSTFDEQAAAAAITTIRTSSFAAASAKRDRDDGADDAAGIRRPTKMGKPTVVAGRELLPAPYFYYRDHSTEQDPDPLTPLTPPGRVPNFPAKMHAILSRKEFEDIVAWLPHGRSWRVLKPREFEIKIIPKFFEHCKFSSFVRQANGWGFRRVTQGKDRNSYYHAKFLRGLPHLCKTMKRPGVAEKKAADPDHEPDLYKISEEHPVPENANDDCVLLHSNLIQGGPKARMPIYWGSAMASQTTLPGMPTMPTLADKTPGVAPTMVPLGMSSSLQGYHQPIVAASEQQVGVQKPPAAAPVASKPTVVAVATVAPARTVAPETPVTSKQVAMPSFMAVSPTTPGATPLQLNPQQHNAYATIAASGNPQMVFPIPGMPAMVGMNAAASAQFAAGFAAATAFSQQHFNNMLGSLAAHQNIQTIQQQQQPKMAHAVPAQPATEPQKLPQQ